MIQSWSRTRDGGKDKEPNRLAVGVAVGLVIGALAGVAIGVTYRAVLPMSTPAPPTSTAEASDTLSPTTPPHEIVLSAPEEDAIVVSPAWMRGRVSLMPFEGTLRGRVYDARGQVVGEQPIQVQPGVEGELDGPGTFAGTIPFQVDATGPGRLEVAEIGARDGSVVVSATVAVTLTADLTGAPPVEPTEPAPVAILDREGIIAHSLNALRERGITWGHDNANFTNVRFPDGEPGAFVAVGFSGIAQGYQFLYRVEDGDVALIDQVSGPIDWGIWSLRDFEKVDLAFPDLFPAEEVERGEIIQVTGAGHAGTGLWVDGYFQIIEIAEQGIHVLFSGAHATINANPNGHERRYEYAYQDLDKDGVMEIIQTGEECQLRLVEGSGLEKADCQPVEAVFHFDGLRYVQLGER